MATKTGSSDLTVSKGKTTLDKLREAKALDVAKDEPTFDELLATLQKEGELLDSSQIGEGYHLLQGKAEKKKLVDVPFVILDWMKHGKGKFGGFVTLKVRTAVPVIFDGQGYSKFIINDGSTGIAQQIDDLSSSGFTGAIVCRKGLRVSEDYEVLDKETKQPIIDPATGKPILGTTFYLDTSL